MSCSVFIATSLDGYIADESGGVDWLTRPEYGAADSSGFGYNEFIADIDAVLMGRNSFEKILTFGEWPFELPVVVLTSRALEVPAQLRGRVVTSSGPPAEVVARLAERGLTRLYVDGGITIQRFLAASLIERLVITIIPVLLGGGIPLFGELSEHVHLELASVNSFPNGFVQVVYEVRAAAGPQ